MDMKVEQENPLTEQVKEESLNSIIVIDTPVVTDTPVATVTTVTTDTTDSNVKTVVDEKKPNRGFAKIKKEFLAPTPTNPLKRNISDVSTTTSHNVEKKKSKKEIKKNRQAFKEGQICLNISRGKECPYGDKCKFSHDVTSFLDKKINTIPGKCIYFEREGKCKYGLGCLFGTDHIIDGKNIINQEKVDSYKPEKLTTNEVPSDIQTLLKKNQYDFKKSVEYMHANNMSIRHLKFVKDQPKQTEVKKEDESTTMTDTTTTTTTTTNDNTTTTTNDNTVQSHENTDIDKIEIKLKNSEKKRIDFKNQLYLAPLTTVGNLPFRRICKKLGVDITCGEMALSNKIVEGHRAELALLKRHSSEDKFGVQICGSYIDSMMLASEFIENELDVDFVDINSGCPIDLICNMGAGSALMEKLPRMEKMLTSCSSVLSCPLTIKLRIGKTEDNPNAHKVIPQLGKWGAAAVTLHGRSRNQRYHRLANWNYIQECAKVTDIPLIANGDIYNYEDVVKYHDSESEFYNPAISSYMVARGALIKPWIFTEIKEKKVWDISANERLDLVKDFVNFGLDHWGSDAIGVDNTRTFLLNWLSFTHRYVPVGILESIHKMNEKPPAYFGRSDLETLLSSNQASDWIKISEMFLGKVHDNYTFVPKHNSNSYESQG